MVKVFGTRNQAFNLISLPDSTHKMVVRVERTIIGICPKKIKYDFFIVRKTKFSENCLRYMAHCNIGNALMI